MTTEMAIEITEVSRAGPDLVAFFRRFEDNPGDLTGYGACADLLDESGYCILAHGYRWMCHRAVWPHKRDFYAVPNRVPGGHNKGRRVPKNHRWAFYRESWDGQKQTGVFPIVAVRHHALPWKIMTGDQKVFQTHQQAVMNLADWLEMLRLDYTPELPKKGL